MGTHTVQCPAGKDHIRARARNFARLALDVGVAPVTGEREIEAAARLAHKPALIFAAGGLGLRHRRHDGGGRDDRKRAKQRVTAFVSWS
jgi:hypothetical protein